MIIAFAFCDVKDYLTFPDHGLPLGLLFSGNKAQIHAVVIKSYTPLSPICKQILNKTIGPLVLN